MLHFCHCIFKPLSPNEANKEPPQSVATGTGRKGLREQPFVGANKLGAGRVSQGKRGRGGGGNGDQSKPKTAHRMQQ